MVSSKEAKKASRTIIVRYGEIFLKSGFVFRQFEKKLLENISRHLKKAGLSFKIKKERGRIFVFAAKEEEAIRALNNVFGLVSFSPAFFLETSNPQEIIKFCQKDFKGFVKKGETFAVRVKRVGQHNYSSQDLEREIGTIITGKANLKNPDKEIFVEVRDNNTYIFTKTYRGLGGFPAQTAGKAIVFLSGGIDSPPAAFLIMKKGCRVVFLHFHSFPLVSKKSIEKCQEIIKKLNNYQLESKLILFPFQKIQLKLKTEAPAKYRIILYRRSMMRLGEKIAKKEKAQALVTGESLAQVSSQTLTNLATIEEAIKLPIFRPLISHDKEEIILIANKIGTFNISIKPQEDCCTLFTPPHPATAAKIEAVKEIEKQVGIEKLESQLLKETKEIFI